MSAVIHNAPPLPAWQQRLNALLEAAYAARAARGKPMTALRFCDRPTRTMETDPNTGHYVIEWCESCQERVAEDEEFLCAPCLADEKDAIACGAPSLLTRPYRDPKEFDGAMRMVLGDNRPHARAQSGGLTS